MSALVSGNWLRNNWLENMFREVLDAKWDQTLISALGAYLKLSRAR